MNVVILRGGFYLLGSWSGSRLWSGSWSGSQSQSRSWSEQ